MGARRLALRLGAPPAVAVLFLVAWQLYTAASGLRESTLPAPTQVLSALYADRQLLLQNGLVTVGEILVGYVAAIALGGGLAVLVHASPRHSLV